MAEVQLQFKTDFTRFLDEKVHKSIKVVTHNGIVECSGVVLAQHSSILKDIVMEDDELDLNNFGFYRECLHILYGGTVTLNDENVRDVLKFFIQFDISEITNKVLKWIGLTINPENFAHFTNITIRCSQGCDKALKEEIFGPCRKFIKNQGRQSTEDQKSQIVEQLVSSSPEICDVLELLLHEDLIELYLPWIRSHLVDDKAVGVFMDTLEKNELTDALAACKKEDVDGVFAAVEGAAKDMKDLKRAYKLKMPIVERMNTVKIMMQFITEDSICKSWRTMDQGGLVLAAKHMNKEHWFYVMEATLSWVTANRPSQYEAEEMITKMLMSLEDEAKCLPLEFQSYIEYNLLQQRSHGYTHLSVNPRSYDKSRNCDVLVTQFDTISHELPDPNCPDDHEREHKLNTIASATKTKYITFYCSSVSTWGVVEIYKDRPPTITLTNTNVGNWKTLYIYGYMIFDQKFDSSCMMNQIFDQNHNRNYSETRIPFYTDPNAAFQMVHLGPVNGRGEYQYTRYALWIFCPQ